MDGGEIFGSKASKSPRLAAKGRELLANRPKMMELRD